MTASQYKTYLHSNNTKKEELYLTIMKWENSLNNPSIYKDINTQTHPNTPTICRYNMQYMNTYIQNEMEIRNKMCTVQKD